jgi:type IV secretion system protein VirB5
MMKFQTIKSENKGEIMSSGQKNTSESYIHSRREWNERYGSYIQAANSWRLVALGSLAIATIAVSGLVYSASQNHIQPYVVEVDKLHATLPIGPADQAAKVDQRVIRAALGSWIENIRSVTPDAMAETQSIKRGYSLIDPSSAAFTVVNEFMRANDPFKRAETGTVAVSVQSILPAGGNGWRIEWQETELTRDGRVVSTTNWLANVTTVVRPPRDEQTILVNPLGIYLTNISWSQRI